MIQIAGVTVNRDVMECHTHESNYVKYLPLLLVIYGHNMSQNVCSATN